MAIKNRKLYNELERLTHQIEHNTASLDDYKKYESILTKAGLPREYLYNYLNRAGFTSWEDLSQARNGKEQIKQEKREASTVGGIVGLGLGLLMASLLKN